jgi:hypothetical protein
VTSLIELTVRGVGEFVGRSSAVRSRGGFVFQQASADRAFRLAVAASGFVDPFRGAVCRVIPGCSAYMVGSDGSVWSRLEQGRWKRWSPTYRRISLVPSGDGYLQLSVIADDGSRIQTKAHKLVALAFYGPRPDGCDLIRHLDGVRDNNSVGNLRYGSYQENAEDTVRHRRSVRGERAWGAKLTWGQAGEIRKRCAAGETHKALAAEYGVHPVTIGDIVRMKSWVPFDNCTGGSDA